nr:MAG TPA: hypothetical protein [Caudoviricetes sp.]
MHGIAKATDLKRDALSGSGREMQRTAEKCRGIVQ